MTKVLLDTSFILTAIRNKLDFFDELESKGYSIYIPNEVIAEIERIRSSTKSLKVKSEAELALKIINSGEHKKVLIGGRYVDSGIKNFLKDHTDFVIATIDANLKRSVKNRKIIIRNKKKLELQ